MTWGTAQHFGHVASALPHGKPARRPLQPRGPKVADGRFIVKKRLSALVGRRALLSTAMTGVAAAAAGAVAAETGAPAPEGGADKRRARYQPNSPEVEEFYRVNRYPAR